MTVATGDGDMCRGVGVKVSQLKDLAGEGQAMWIWWLRDRWYLGLVFLIKFTETVTPHQSINHGWCSCSQNGTGASG